MSGVPQSVATGYYARHQIASRDPIIGWSHRRRFQRAVALARPFAGRRLLDYGSGDATFLGLLDAGEAPPALAVGADIDPRIVADCTRRFAAQPRLRFVHVDALDRVDQAGAFDAVFCMEVLEHVTDPPVVLARLERLLRPGGTLVVSVPIETGVPILVKQLVRRVAGWRHLGDYPGTSRYRPGELARSVFAGTTQHLDRPVFHQGEGAAFHDHKGFNWRVLRTVVASRFQLIRTFTSPFNWLGPLLGTQVWFVARRPSAGDR